MLEGGGTLPSAVYNSSSNLFRGRISGCDLPLWVRGPWQLTEGADLKSSLVKNNWRAFTFDRGIHLDCLESRCRFTTDSWKLGNPPNLPKLTFQRGWFPCITIRTQPISWLLCTQFPAHIIGYRLASVYPKLTLHSLVKLLFLGHNHFLHIISLCTESVSQAFLLTKVSIWSIWWARFQQHSVFITR